MTRMMIDFKEDFPSFDDDSELDDLVLWFSDYIEDGVFPFSHDRIRDAVVYGLDALKQGIVYEGYAEENEYE